MANIKITELNGILEKDSADVLPIVDVSANETKKITIADLVDKNVELIAVVDTAPAECSTGDKYYNTTTKKIYTATATDTWDTTGEDPISGILYIVYADQASYSWDGTDLVSVGGGKEDIVIGNTEPTDPDVKLWIDTGEVASASSEITDSYSTSAGLGYSCNYMNGVIGKILWTNESPSSNIADGTQITLSSDDYDMLEIYYKYTTGNSNMWSKKILKGFSCYLDIAVPYYVTVNYTANEYRIFTRNSDTQYTLSDAKITYSGSANTTRTDFIIPLYIIGYKTGLFS